MHLVGECVQREEKFHGWNWEISKGDGVFSLGQDYFRGEIENDELDKWTNWKWEMPVNGTETRWETKRVGWRETEEHWVEIKQNVPVISNSKQSWLASEEFAIERKGIRS